MKLPVIDRSKVEHGDSADQSKRAFRAGLQRIGAASRRSGDPARRTVRTQLLLRSRISRPTLGPHNARAAQGRGDRAGDNATRSSRSAAPRDGGKGAVMYKNILIAINDSRAAESAVDAA